MAEYNYQVKIALATIDCDGCGGTYALNKHYLNRRWENGGSWHCPYCQQSTSYITSESER